MKDDQILIVSEKDRNVYVQFVAQGKSGMRAEAVSNQFLEVPDRLDARARKQMLGLGWSAPTHRMRNGATTSEGPPNYYADPEYPVPFGKVSALAVVTLAQVYRVTGLRDLQYKTFHA